MVAGQIFEICEAFTAKYTEVFDVLKGYAV